MLNKINVMDYLSIAHIQLVKTRSEHRQELVEVPASPRSQKMKDRRKRRRGSSDSNSDSDGSRSCSGSDDDNSSELEDINESGSSESGPESKVMVQKDLPYDENDTIEEMKDSEETWTEFLKYCIDLTACNLQYIMMTREEEFMRKVTPDVIEMVVSKNI